MGLTIGAALSPSRAGAARPARKQILFFTKSSGYEHSVIKKIGGQPSHAETVLTALAEPRGWAITHTKDGRIFGNPSLAAYDAFFFYTTGDLTAPGTDGAPPMTPAGKTALLAAIRKGKGFVGAHCAADTFHGPTGPRAGAADDADPYLRMLGAEFIGHGRQQPAKMTCADQSFPGCSGIAKGFELVEEWYAFTAYQEDLRVILVQETAGMATTGSDHVYDRPPFPATWARRHAKGRVFYTSMGHREDVWTNPFFQAVLAGGIAWALGEARANATPNIERVTPRYGQFPR
jgi:type 1 glutamine amidotransferase